LKTNADPDRDLGTGSTLKNIKKMLKTTLTLTLKENKVAVYPFYNNYIAFYFFYPNYLPFGCVLRSFLALFRPPGSGSAFRIWIRIQAANEYRSNADPDPKYYTIEIMCFMSHLESLVMAGALI
jgi:hypothetical protein